MEFKCKICAGSLSINPQTKIAVCDYCGTKQALPMFGDDSSKVLFERGNQYLLHNEYDKAENIFNQLLSVNPNDAEIYWDLVLCKYGVTYAKDPKTEKYIPTCNRTHTESVFSNPNYKKAIELSLSEKAELYKQDAEIIDKIQKGILEVSKKEKPFDIFISYKETDDAGYRTKDSIAALKLYEKLTSLGYKVFFARVTLESKVGEEYEPIIYAALSSSKVMITICSSQEYIQAPWVKNEWSRFLIMRRNNISKTLIPVYYDMDSSELPEEFALLSAQNMKADDFEQELIRGIKKLIPTPITRKENRKKIRKVAIIAVAILILVSIPTAYFITKPGRIEKANREQYELAMASFNNGDYTTAKNIFDTLSGFENSDEMSEKCTYYGPYLEAMQLYYDRNYPEATWAFAAIGDYPEVIEMREKCEKAWRESLATVAIDVDMNYLKQGSYYVTLNGTVDSFSDNYGTSNVEVQMGASGEKIGENDISINEHGKVVSIAGNEELYVLYEDGFVLNSAYNNKMEFDWENVIQITDRFNVSNVALLDDGTLVYGDVSRKIVMGDIVTDENMSEVSDEWLKEVDDWNNIIEIDYSLERTYSTTGGIYWGVLVGLDSDGYVHMVSTVNDPCEIFGDEPVGGPDYDAFEDAENYLESLSNIKKICLGNLERKNTGDAPDDYIQYLNIVALDNDNILHIMSIDGQTEKEIGEIKDFWIDGDGEIYIVDSYNKLKILDDDKTILEGIVYINDGYCVSQSGTIYQIDGTSTDGKTKVSDIWLEK